MYTQYKHMAIYRRNIAIKWMQIECVTFFNGMLHCDSTTHYTSGTEVHYAPLVHLTLRMTCTVSQVVTYLVGVVDISSSV